MFCGVEPFKGGGRGGGRGGCVGGRECVLSRWPVPTPPTVVPPKAPSALPSSATGCGAGRVTEATLGFHGATRRTTGRDGTPDLHVARLTQTQPHHLDKSECDQIVARVRSNESTLCDLFSSDDSPPPSAA